MHSGSWEWVTAIEDGGQELRLSVIGGEEPDTADPDCCKPNRHTHNVG